MKSTFRPTRPPPEYNSTALYHPLMTAVHERHRQVLDENTLTSLGKAFRSAGCWSSISLERATSLYQTASNRRYLANSRRRLNNSIHMHSVRTLVVNRFLPLLCVVIGVSFSVYAQNPKAS